MPRSQRAPAAHLPGLDLLRAAAIVAVMLCHADSFDLLRDADIAGDYAWMGVDLFFALSGFLIAGQLLPFPRGERPDFPRFFARRLLRTLPAYLVVVGVYFAFPALQDRPHIARLWKLLTFTQNIGLTPGTALSHGWSLSVEEQFYLAFPLAVALIGWRARPGRVAAAIAAVVLCGMALRGYLWLRYVAATPFDIAAHAKHGGAYMTLIYYPTWTRLDGLLGGVCVALVSTFRPRWWAALTARANVCLAAGLAGVGAALALFGGEIGGFFASTLGFPLLALSMALLVVAGAAPGSLISRWRIPGAAALAAGAYSLYLSHKIVFHLVADASKAWLPAAQILALPIALAGALAVGAALYWLVERPFLKLRDRFREPRPAAPAVIAATQPAE